RPPGASGCAPGPCPPPPPAPPRGRPPRPAPPRGGPGPGPGPPPPSPPAPPPRGAGRRPARCPAGGTGSRTAPPCAAQAGTTSRRSVGSAGSRTRPGSTASDGLRPLFFEAVQHPAGVGGRGRVLLVVQGGDRAAVAGPEQVQVAADLAGAGVDAAVGQGRGQLRGGPSSRLG